MSKEKSTKQMSLQGDFLANHSALQEKENQQQMIVTSGMKCLELLEKSNQDGLLAKMLKVLLTSTTAWCSDRCKLIWKSKVSKSNVLLFQLQASVLGIKENEFGLWPTPTAQDHSRNTIPPSIGKTRGMDLSMRVVADQIRMYPTPTQDSAHERTKKYKQGGTPLSMAVKMFPTPTASDTEGGAAKPGGKLNPNFVEFLMGYPMNWTKIDPTE